MKWFLFCCLLPFQGIVGEDASIMFRKLMQYDVSSPRKVSNSNDGKAYVISTTTTHGVDTSKPYGTTNPGGSKSYSAYYPETIVKVELLPTQQYSSSYYIPSPSASQKESYPLPEKELMCPGSAVGCFQGHLRHCLSANMKQNDAKIVRMCENGCKICGMGIPDVCLDEHHGADVCEVMAVSNRPQRTCTPAQNGVVGCMDGPDIGYCFQSLLYVVDFCGESDCKGSSKPDRCNDAVTSVTTSAVSVPTVAVSSNAVDIPAEDICTSNALVCFEGHIRLCVTNMPKKFGRVFHDCRSQGCSKCEQGPDLCNDEKLQNVCEKVPQDLYLADCKGREPDSDYCDSDNVRVCEPGGRGVLVEYCDGHSCQQSPARCFRPLPPAEVCQGTYVLCYQGHIRLCKDKQPISQSEILHNCRAQGCSECENAPAMCNNEQRQSQCTEVSSDRFVIACPAEQQGITFCANGDDVRHCDPSGRAFLVEYCGNRGCQADRCNAPGPITTSTSPVLVNPGGKGQTGPSPTVATTNTAPTGRIVANPGPSPTSAVDAPTFARGPSPTSDRGLPPSARGPSPTSARGPSPTFASGPSPTPARVVNPDTAPPTPNTAPPTPNTCGERVRTEWGAMPDAARAQYIKAVNQLYASGEIAQLARLHYDNRDQIHGTGVDHFFVWHRVFLFDFEERLRALPGFACVTIPYWNYDFSNNQADRRSAIGTQSTKLGQGRTQGCIGGPFASVTHTLEGQPTCIRRNPNVEALATLTNSYFVDLCQIGEVDWAQFSSNLQNAHGYPHVSFGGTFSTHYSPIDPLFWVHHANIDRMWDLWQDCHVDYQWYEPRGLNTPVIAYEGVIAGDFIDNTQCRWKGKSFSVKYSSDQFSDPSVYSTDFRRNVLTRCRDGKFRRYDSPNPILGVDDVWARTTDRSFEFQPGTTQPPELPEVQVRQENVPLPCTNPAGTSEFISLQTNTVPVAVYDNAAFPECAARCASFYWKKSGASNCVCMKAAEKKAQTTASLNEASIKRFQPTCSGSDADYGFYQVTPVSGSSRRLLQEESQEAGSSESFEEGNILQNDGSSPETDSDFGSEPNNTDSFETFIAVPSNDSDSNSSLVAVPLDDFLASQESSFEAARGDVASQDLQIVTLDESADSLDSDSSEEIVVEAESGEAASPTQQLCFDVPAVPKNRTEVVCTSKASTPIPLPRAWLLMNNLDPDVADVCQTWKPAVGSKSVSCVNV